MVLLVAFFFALAPLALSSLCFAEEGDSIGPRLGIAVGGVMGLAGNWPGGDDPLTFGRGRPAGMVGPQVDAAALNPTLQLDLGVRFNRHVGAFIRKRRSRQLFFSAPQRGRPAWWPRAFGSDQKQAASEAATRLGCGGTQLDWSTTLSTTFGCRALTEGSSG